MSFFIDLANQEIGFIVFLGNNYFLVADYSNNTTGGLNML